MEGQGYEEEIAVTHHGGAGRSGDHHGGASRSGHHSGTEDNEGGHGNYGEAETRSIQSLGAASVAMTERGNDL